MAMLDSLILHIRVAQMLAEMWGKPAGAFPGPPPVKPRGINPFSRRAPEGLHLAPSPSRIGLRD